MLTRFCSRISIGLLALATLAPLRGSDVVSVSAASFRPGAVAPESIVAAFGEMRAVAPQSATSLPLPTLLGGLRVTVRDSAGVERPRRCSSSPARRSTTWCRPAQKLVSPK